ncbi:hypothetical protein K2173_015847 [Erythroxylum novogranatense]|uniref:Uncharacterized protein n=1 Tax=Erythroxylum novogranatense TaxID=1862640 RepID=A0AAV8SEK0_9ROSI|nr:hypothetical protein K2173_015847 [Erythroxylum novogranatense]
MKIKESTIVRPARETPTTRLQSSNLDLLVARIHLLTVYFYKPTSSENFFDAKVLKEGLSQALVHFYPVAGRLQRDENGRIEIDCNGEGVLFVEAESSRVMDEFGDFTPSFEMLELVPEVDYSDHISSFPLLILQLTSFRCGGVCLGVGWHHTLADGSSAMHFINSWSDVTRGLSVHIPPFIDRTPLAAGNPPTPTFDHAEYDPPPSMNTLDQNGKYQSSEKPACTKILKLTLDQINTLKATSKQQDGATKYSTYETLAAHIWRCMCMARELDADQPTRLYIATDGRSRLRPPLPSGYFGNVIFTTTVTSLSGDIKTETLVQTIKRLRESLKRMDNEYLRSALDHLQVQPDLGALVRGPTTFKSPNLNVNSWISLPTHDADFGWGRPLHMGPASVLYEGTVYILKTPAKDGGLSVIIRLEDDILQRFETLLCDF